MAKHIQFILLVLIVAVNFGCKASKRASSNNTITKRNFRDSLQYQFDQNSLFQQIFTGFALFDPEQSEMIFESNAHKYYTPASNTKIFTFYAASQILGDSLPGLRYELRGDSLRFWGTGDPTLLYRYVSDSSRVIDFLRSRTEQLVYCPGNWNDDAFGAGWAWDDYFYSYQLDKAPMPIYGNRVRIQGHPAWDYVSLFPPAFRQMFQWSKEVRTVERALDENLFYIHPQRTESPRCDQNWLNWYAA
ncbi:MAG: D-alanyl-D-alanine carboxypeptidase, partial [Bacteroidota bacterium]